MCGVQDHACAVMRSMLQLSPGDVPADASAVNRSVPGSSQQQSAMRNNIAELLSRPSQPDGAASSVQELEQGSCTSATAQVERWNDAVAAALQSTEVRAQLGEERVPMEMQQACGSGNVTGHMLARACTCLCIHLLEGKSH
jgi:hypothetical protein